MAWVLINGKLTPEEGKVFAGVMQKGHVPAMGELFIPVLPSGLVEEITYIDQKIAIDTRISVRSLGWLERVIRMAWRVFWVWRKLAPYQRQQCGLLLSKIFTDLSNAYATATEFRGIPYSRWLNAVDALTMSDRTAICQKASCWNTAPHFSIRLIGDTDDARQKLSLASLDRQLYRNFSLATEDRQADKDWLILLKPGDQLADHALFWFACEAQTRPDAAIIYSDDDEINADGQRCRPRFKPDWSLTHLRSTNYIGRAAVLNGCLVAEAGGVRPEYLADDGRELLLRIAELAGDRVAHIPAVLLHRDAEVEKKVVPVINRMRFELPATPPLVSIIIPTRDAVQLLRQCVESLLEKTTYPRYEILVVDNGSSEPEALDYLNEIATRPGVRVLRYDRPFNFSAINNFATNQAQGEVICLLNNDTEVISPDWLDEMVGHLLQEKMGVVGAKLYYSDGRVQHAGDVAGPGGCANHLHSFIGRHDPGYCNRAIVAQELSAVTAACMVTWKRLYDELGGLNEKHLPIAFNDVDYCLRVRKAGYKVVWTPYAELYHHESASRGKDKSLRRKIRAELEVRYMRRKWKEEMKNDPFYNPNFSYLRPDFVLSPAPQVKRPWIT